MSTSKSALLIGSSTWSQHGGIQRFNRRVIASLETLGAEFSVLMKNDKHTDFPIEKSNLFGFDRSIKSFLIALLKQSHSYDNLLVTHINFLPFAMIYKILNPNGKVLLFAHGIEVWGDSQYRKPRFYDKLLLRALVDTTAVVSRYSQNLMSNAFGLLKTNFELFPNAVDVPSEKPILNNNNSKILVVSRLGSNESEKHVDKVIIAFKAVVRKIPDAQLHIVGDGPLKQGLINLSKSLSVAEHVRFSGFVTDEELQEAYETASVFALPSSKEGFGIVYLEAWIKGLPVIASRFGAGAEVVSDGIDGYTVDPCNLNELQDRLIMLLEDKELSKNLANNGYNKVLSKYSGIFFTERLNRILFANIDRY